MGLKRSGCWALCFLWAVAGGYGEAPTFQSLMSPMVLPAPQRGMVVEDAREGDGRLGITTTGAEMTLDIASGKAVFRQRIGVLRPVVSARLGEGFSGGAVVTHRAPGVAFVRFSGPRVDLRVNGDSLFMFHAREAVRIEVARAIPVGFEASYGSNHLLLDEFGGFGLYCSEQALEDRYAPYGDTTAVYDPPADAVLWVGVCPPKAYDWERSFRDNVVWHWSREIGYPPDETLASWAQWGNMALLQSEVMLWKDWNLAFEPRLGPGEFARVRETLHANNMRFMVYTSPAYFFQGTALENRAFNSFENFQGWPPVNENGENMEDFLAAISGVMTTLRPDGLYFDGQYYKNPAALYALARRSRAIVGEDGLLEWHSTFALGTDLCFLPQADAYVDFILRGEGEDGRYGDFNYLSYFVSCYNTSNSIGVLCNNGPLPTPPLVRRVLEANGRLHTLVRWLKDPGLMSMLDTEYRRKLVPGLRDAVEMTSALRQEGLAARTARLLEEDRALHAPPAWTRAVMTEAFTTMPAWEAVISPRNARALDIDGGGLRIQARAHTYAYLKEPLAQPVSGIVVKLRQGTDGGMSWGPAVLLRWANGRSLRLGLRSDGKIQVNRDGRERLFAGQDLAGWNWLRARWLDELCVIEHSLDGADYRCLLTYRHGGDYAGPASELLVGKVPYNGKPEDHSEPGKKGTCEIAEVVVY